VRSRNAMTTMKGRPPADGSIVLGVSGPGGALGQHLQKAGNRGKSATHPMLLRGGVRHGHLNHSRTLEAQLLGLLRIGKATAGVDGVDFAVLMDGGRTLLCMVERAAISALVRRAVTSGQMLDEFKRVQDQVQAMVMAKVERGQTENGMVFVELVDVERQQGR
jgi:hypothetical protein